MPVRVLRFQSHVNFLLVGIESPYGGGSIDGISGGICVDGCGHHSNGANSIGRDVNSSSEGLW